MSSFAAVSHARTLTRTQWSAAAAHRWYNALPWLVGCNFTPSYAINQLEMWQAETFNLELIRAELALAASLGMNSVRVYLHDLLWEQDAAGLLDRIDAFLGAAEQHRIGTMFVLFDSCWDPHPALGTQRAPQTGIHNSGWVQSPGMKVLAQGDQNRRLEAYVRDVVGRYASDKRVLAWDIWNEPDNGPEVALCDPVEIKAKSDLVVPLLRHAFEWARAEAPIQPLTSGIWLGDWSAPDLFSPIQRLQTDQSDVISFHNYGTAADFAQRVKWLKAFGRPLLCTEFMARPTGSTFEAILPTAKDEHVATFCWGLVQGKTQTHLPWDSWTTPYLDGPVGPWFHDIFDADGQPHRAEEVAFIRQMTGPATGRVRRQAGHAPREAHRG